MSNIEESKPVFELSLEKITGADIKAYCALFKIPLIEVTGTKAGKKSLYVPGHFIIGLFRHIVPVMSKKYSNFPLKELTSFYGYNGGTIENRLFINQKIMVRMQNKNGDGGSRKPLMAVDFIRLSDKKKILSGLFTFVGR
jgi:hypothetical protein